MEHLLADRAAEDRAAVAAAVAGGESGEQAAADYVTDAAFKAWYQDFCGALDAAVNK